MSFETVHAITDFHDRPQGGVATFQGRPHFFESEWDEAADDYAGTFRLSPVDSDVVTLAMEDRAISERWWMAFYGGRTTEETPRVLPEDRGRYAELQRRLKKHLRIDPENYVRARAEFRTSPDWNGIGLAPSEVQWELCVDGA
jgi:hypothetical protein